MDRQTYMKAFSLRIRWRLPAPEADGVLADYAEMLSQRSPEQDSNLLQDLGAPDFAAKLLTDRHAYLRWLAGFFWMTACLLVPLAALLQTSLHPQPPLLFLPLLAGMATSLIAFRPRRNRSGLPLPRRLLCLLLGLIALLAAAAGVLICLISGIWTQFPPSWYGITAHGILSLTGIAFGIAGLFGLVQARVSDRRWIALYGVGLTGLTLCAMVAAFQTSLSIPEAVPWTSYGIQWCAIGVIGLVGSGVSLC